MEKPTNSITGVATEAFGVGSLLNNLLTGKANEPSA
jgi:hypothetical protein